MWLLKVHSMPCNKGDVEKIFMSLRSKQFTQFNISFIKVHFCHVVGFKVFVDLETILRPMFEITNKSLWSFDFFLILFHVGKVRISLNKLSITKALVNVAVPLLKDMGGKLVFNDEWAFPVFLTSVELLRHCFYDLRGYLFLLN